MANVSAENTKITDMIDSDEFRAHYMSIIFNHCKIDADTDCLLWQSSRNNNYGQVTCTYKVKMQDGSLKGFKKNTCAHRLMYAVATNSLYLLTPAYKNIDVSHLCHTPLCCNIMHLEAESKSTNNSRTRCKNRGTCQEHYPQCIFNSKK